MYLASPSDSISSTRNVLFCFVFLALSTFGSTVQWVVCCCINLLWVFWGSLLPLNKQHKTGLTLFFAFGHYNVRTISNICAAASSSLRDCSRDSARLKLWREKPKRITEFNLDTGQHGPLNPPSLFWASCCGTEYLYGLARFSVTCSWKHANRSKYEDTRKC